MPIDTLSNDFRDMFDHGYMEPYIPPQPSLATVQFEIEGVGEFDVIPPEYLLEANFKVKTEGMDEFSITVFDESWEFFTQAVGLKNKITYRYGYANAGVWSDTHEGTILSLEITMQQNGVQVAISGLGRAIAIGNMEKRNRAFVGKKIHEVVQIIAQEWKDQKLIDSWDIEPTRQVVGQEDLLAVSAVNETLRQNNMTDYQILRKLQTIAVSAQTGRGEYTFTVDEAKRKLIFRTKPRETPSEVTYYYMRHIESPVISFTPTFENLVNFTGGGEVRYVGTNPISKANLERKWNQVNTEDKVMTGPKAETTTVQSSDGSTLAVPTAARTQERLDRESLSHYEHAMSGITKATMEIVGNPRFQVMRSINVIPLMDRPIRIIGSGAETTTNEHFSAGKYFVDEVEHQISMGTYTTSVQLSCRGLKRFASPQDKTQGIAGQLAQAEREFAQLTSLVRAGLAPSSEDLFQKSVELNRLRRAQNDEAVGVTADE